MNTIIKRIVTYTLVAAMAFSMSVVPSSAASKSKMIEDIDYEGKGVVEVDFRGDVKYKNVKVTVKDNKGKKYKARILKKDEDDLKFKIKKYKKGRTYTFKIKRVKKWNGGKYRTLKGKVKIKKSSSSKYIGKAKAKAIALKKVGLTASQVRFTKVKFERDDGVSVYEIEFVRGYVEYEFEINARTGRIIEWDMDYDD